MITKKDAYGRFVALEHLREDVGDAREDGRLDGGCLQRRHYGGEGRYSRYVGVATITRKLLYFTSTYGYVAVDAAVA